jgi:porin
MPRNLGSRLFAVIFVAWTISAAEDASRAAMAADVPAGSGNGIPPGSIATSLPGNGDPGGVRKWLAERGVNYGFIYNGEILGNVSGGVRRGAIFEGKLEAYVNADLEKLVGWRGLTFFSSAFQIHGTGGLRRDNLLNLTAISNIEALPSTRLSEIWLEQTFFNDKLGIRFGQLTADSEFFISDHSGVFINSGWPTITAENLPSGGPAYPLSTPGIRVKVNPTKDVSLLAALFNGDPAGPGPGEAEEKNRHGLNFRLRDPAFLIGEAQYRYNQDKRATGLAGTIKLGGWYHFDRFDDQRFGTDGRSLADPASNGIPRRLRGTSGLYGIIDQQIYRPPGGDAESGVAVFARIAASPPDRNLIDFYVDGGVTFFGMITSRPDDKFGATFTYAGVSSDARALDRDRVVFTGIPYPIRNYEMTFELTYQAQIVPGWTVQPDFQYVINPGGNVPNPNDPTGLSPIKNAAIFGLRTIVKY